MAPLSAPAIRTAVRELRAVLYARCRYLLSRVTAHYHACDVPETRPHGTPMIVSRLRLLSSTKRAMAGTDASCYQGHRPGRSKHKKKPVGSPESQSKISEGVGDPRAGASGAMRAPTTRRRKTSRGCACLSLTPPAYLRLAVGAAAFAVALHFNPPGAWLKPRPSLTHAALVATSSPPAATVSPSSVVGAGRAAGIARPPTPLCALALAASVGQQCRPARRDFGPRVVAIANPSHPGPPAPD